MPDLNNNQPATKDDLKVLEHRIDDAEKNIQEDIYEVGKIVATKDDLQQTQGVIVTNIKDHIDKKMGELRGDLVFKQNKTIEAVKRFAEVFTRTKNLSAVDKSDMKLVKELLEAKPQP